MTIELDYVRLSKAALQDASNTRNGGGAGWDKCVVALPDEDPSRGRNEHLHDGDTYVVRYRRALWWNFSSLIIPAAVALLLFSLREIDDRATAERRRVEQEEAAHFRSIAALVEAFSDTAAWYTALGVLLGVDASKAVFESRRESTKSLIRGLRRGTLPETADLFLGCRIACLEEALRKDERYAPAWFVLGETIVPGAEVGITIGHRVAKVTRERCLARAAVLTPEENLELLDVVEGRQLMLPVAFAERFVSPSLKTPKMVGKR